MTIPPPPDRGPKTARNIGIGLIAAIIIGAIVTVVLIAMLVGGAF